MSQPKIAERTIPLLLLALCILAFGLLIPWLGFYWDDWPVILIARLQDARGFLEFYRYDRPVSAWTYILTTPLLGTSPLPWHIFTLLLRWITAVGLWWCLRGVWSEQPRLAAWAAILFTVYPSFLQQPIAVAFSQHWITFALYFASLGLMIQAYRRRKGFLPLSLLALALCALHLFTMEYFLGLELLRPAFLWLLFGAATPSGKERLGRSLKAWLPYLGVVVAFIVWRSFFLELAGEDPNQLSLIQNLAAEPAAALTSLLQLALQDFVHLLLGAWSATIDPAIIDLTSTFFLLSAAAAVVGGLLTAFYLLRLRRAATENSGDRGQPSAWHRQAISLGFAAILLGFLPVWLTERGAIEGMYSSRFTLAASFGASLLLVGLLEWFTPRLLPKVILLSLLVGLAVRLHLSNANDYRWSWVSQQRFYWQLAWRAPQLQPNTAVLSADELFPYVGVYSTSTALNLLYEPLAEAEQLSYWFYSLGRGIYRQTEQLLAGMQLQAKFRTFLFNGNSKDSLVIYYEPLTTRCLWVLSPQDQELRSLPELTRSVLSISNLDRIQATPAAPGYPPKEVFGAEPELPWCRLFQQADLASQLGDWQTVTRLGKQAQQEGLDTDYYREARPFILAYAQTGDWESAQAWTLSLPRVGPDVDAVCNLWKRLGQELPDSPAKRASLERVLERFACPP